jgi:uncharacterized protein (TIGR03905 family)
MYIYRTQKPVCPPEIHFEIKGSTISKVRFVGGGCLGNAQLVSRLLEGKKVDALPHIMKGIQCRGGTSCPDQLAKAIEKVNKGELVEAEPISIYEDTIQRKKVVLVAEVNGDYKALEKVIKEAKRIGVGAIYCLGNLTGPDGENDAVMELVGGEGVVSLQNPFDRVVALKKEIEYTGISTPIALKSENREQLLINPFLLSFQLGGCKAIGFHSGFIQKMEGFSDYSRYSLEILTVSNLSDYLRNDEVFPVLKEMTEQYYADAVFFAHTSLWKHIRLGKADFINIGAMKGRGGINYALVEWQGEEMIVSFKTI